MRKILSLIIFICISLLCFTSCDRLEEYEDNLRTAGYDIDLLDDEDIDSILSFLNNGDDYKIKSGFAAEYWDYNEYVLVLECSSKSDASNLADEISKEIGITVQSHGNLVFVGDENAINNAFNPTKRPSKENNKPSYNTNSGSSGGSSNRCSHESCKEYGPFPCYGKNNTCPNYTYCYKDLYCDKCD